MGMYWTRRRRQIIELPITAYTLHYYASTACFLQGGACGTPRQGLARPPPARRRPAGQKGAGPKPVTAAPSAGGAAGAHPAAAGPRHVGAEGAVPLPSIIANAMRQLAGEGLRRGPLRQGRAVSSRRPPGATRGWTGRTAQGGQRARGGHRLPAAAANRGGGRWPCAKEACRLHRE